MGTCEGSHTDMRHNYIGQAVLRRHTQWHEDVHFFNGRQQKAMITSPAAFALDIFTAELLQDEAIPHNGSMPAGLS